MEANIKRIVVGFDFSEPSQAALEAAVFVARLEDATLHVVTTVNGPLNERVTQALSKVPSRSIFRRTSYMEDVGLLEEVGTLVQSEVERPERSSISIRYDIGELPVAQQLLETSHTMGADMIVVGAYGNEPLPRDRMVSPFVERLVIRSMLPVLVLRPEQAFPPRRILCAVDFSEASERALGWALDMARMVEDAEIDVFHVISRSRRPTGRGRSAAHTEMNHFLSGFQVPPRLKMRTHIAQGVPHQIIASRLVEGDYDMLSIGTVGRSAFMEMLVGGTAERAIRATPCTILAVKPDSFAAAGRTSGSFKAITGSFRAVK